MPERAEKRIREMSKTYGPKEGKRIAIATENRDRRKEGKAPITRSNPHGRGKR